MRPLTLMPDDAEVLTVEFRVNLLTPPSGERLFAKGEVVRAGRTLTVCRGDAYAEQRGECVHVCDDGASGHGVTNLIERERRPLLPTAVSRSLAHVLGLPRTIEQVRFHVERERA